MIIRGVKDWLRRWLEVPAFDMPSSTRSAGQSVCQDNILKLSAAWSCVNLISNSISTLPIHIYEKKGDKRVRADDHSLAKIIKIQPHSEILAATFWQSAVANLLLNGNSVSRKIFYKDKLVGLKPLQQGEFTVDIDDSGSLIFYERTKDGLKKIPRNEIFRIVGFSLNSKWGVSVIEYGAGVFGSALAVASAANNTLENCLNPTIAFSTDKRLTPDQRNFFRENLGGLTGAINAGKSPILEEGMKAVPLSFNPKDAQLLETRGFGVEEICRLFGVDPSMVGHGGAVSNWGTGLEEKVNGFLRFTISPWLEKIEQAINAQLLTPEEQLKYYVEYSAEGFLRANSATRAAYLRSMTESGIMTRDEARAKENLPPMHGNAAKLMVNSATQPIDSLGAIDK